MLELLLTRDDANSDSALVVEWLVEDEQAVRGGQAVCVVETAKALIEIEAPGDGRILQLVRPGDEVELGRPLALIAQDEDELGRQRMLRDEKAAERTEARSSGPENATRDAIEAAKAYGIDLTTIATDGFITADDVERRARERDQAPRGAVDLRLAGVSTYGVTLPDTFRLDEEEGKLDPDFFARLLREPDSVSSLGTDKKCALYREHGANVGENVTFGDGALVVAPRIVIGAGTRIGAMSSVRCEEIFAVGPLGLFGPRLEVSCRRAFLGATAYVGRDVRIGGGGAHDPWGTFVAGDLLYIGDEAFINPCRPVVLGREVYVTMRSMIVTHNIGHSILEGFENRFEPVVLEDLAQIGLAAVVYAGARIGRESIVASNSYVVTGIPAGKLAIGVPARVAGDARRTPTRARRRELVDRMLEKLAELLALNGHDVAPFEVAGERGIEIRIEGRRSIVFFTERLDAGLSLPDADGEIVVLTFELAADPPSGAAVLDLLGRCAYGEGGPVFASVREFCRKQGIRFGPDPWRHTGGLV